MQPTGRSASVEHRWETPICRNRISKALDAEAEYWEEDLRFAKQGAGFLAIRCGTDAEAQRVLRLLQPEHPRKMRRYGQAAIEELIK